MFSNELINSKRIALWVEYDGSAYFGWQKQTKPPVASVQESLERALAKVANHPVKVFCAGRTDARVHASAQLVHFESEVLRSQKGWIKGTNTGLPDDIVVTYAQAVPDDFHARHSAIARSYRYVIANTAVRSANFAKRVTHIDKPLDAQRMHEAAQALLGEHDFSAYRGAGCQSKSPMRRVEYVQVTRQADLVVIEIKANAFVLHMVRNIAGVLIDIGLGKQPMHWAQQVLEGKDRSAGGKTAAAEGLYFVRAHYPASCGLPEFPLGPLFLAE